MSPAGPESASNESKIQQQQLRIDTFDRQNDGKVEGTDKATAEQVAERTKTYINRVNDVQGRIRSLRLKVEIGKDMRNPNWPALEKACNDVEDGLAQKLVAVTVENLESGIPEFSASIDRFLQSLQTEEIRDVRRYAAGPADAAALRRRSDEAYNVRLVEARKTGGIAHVDAIDEVIRSNEAELAYLRGGVQPAGWRFDLWGTVQQRREALEGVLPVYRAERRKVLESLPKDQPTIQRLCDRSDAAWVAMNTARSNLRSNRSTDVTAVVMTYETLIDVNEEELSFLESHPNPSTVNDKTGERLTSRMVRIREMLPLYRTEYSQLRGEQPAPGADVPKTTAEQIINKLAEGTGSEPKLLAEYARTAREVYGEDTLRTVASRVALVNKLNPAICEAAGFPFRPPVDAKQLTIQLGTGVLPVRPTPQQAETVTHAYLLGRPEDVVRRKYEFVLDRITGPQKKIAELNTFIENETKNLANETRNDADEQVVKQLARNIESARASIRSEQETITGYQQILFNLEASLTVFDATVARNDGRQQESDRIYLKLREKYGPDLAKMDADLGKRVTEAIEGLKKRNQLTPFELALVEGRDQDAVKLAVDRQQSNRDSDLLAQVRAVPPRSVDVRMLRRGGIPDEDGGPMPGGRVLTIPRGGRRGGPIDLGVDFENTTEKFRKQGREFLLAQNGQNGVTVTETGANDFFKMYNVKTATLDGTFTCGFDGEWSFSEYKPGQRNGYLNPNWFTDAAIPEAERNAFNAIHRGLLERSDPEVRRRREDRERGPELGNFESGRVPDIFGPRNDIVNSSFSIQPFDSYMGRYEREEVPVEISTSNVAGFRGTSLFKLSVSGADHLVAFDSGFVSKLPGTPPGYTALQRRAPSRPTFVNVYRVPSNPLRERTRLAQQATSFDTLK
ncbi:MAG TPA: hypothetical protein PKV72_04400, partial [Candidatus Peribacteria bacterium]|nr:hypothetical protein [Candidatus Peribacteria bacterium]